MPKPRHIILIGIDNLRFDLVSAFPDRKYLSDFAAGQEGPQTPTLDALAAESFWFQTCVSAAGYTPPSFAAAFTGTYAYRHGLVDFQYSYLDPAVPTLFQLLGSAGYRSIAMARDPALFTATGLSRGLESLCADERELFAQVMARDGRPVVIFAHFLDCHLPFLWTDLDDARANDDFFSEMKRLFGEDLRPLSDDSRALGVRAEELTHGPLPPGRRVSDHYGRAVKLYLNAVAKYDRGRLSAFVGQLKQLGIWDTSYVVVFSDHGEMRHPEFPHLTTHGPFVAEELTRVVLMLKGPGITPGVSKELVGLVDLTPTLLDLVGVSPPGYSPTELDGVSLCPLMGAPSGTGMQRWYLQEGWLGFMERRSPPVRAERAVRTGDGLRYVFRGEDADLTDGETRYGKELAKWLSKTFLPTRWDSAPEREALLRRLSDAGGTPADAFALVLEQERRWPRYAIYDTVVDPLQRHPIRVTFAPTLWEDYLAKYRWMMSRSGPCYPRPEVRPGTPDALHCDEEEEQELAERLRALGYHD